MLLNLRGLFAVKLMEIFVAVIDSMMDNFEMNIEIILKRCRKDMEFGRYKMSEEREYMEESCRTASEKVKERELKKSWHIFRILLLATVLAVGVICLGNCGSQGTTDKADASGDSADSAGDVDKTSDNEDNSRDSGNVVDILTLQEKMLAASDALPDMTTVNSQTDGAEDLFAYLSGLDYEKVQSYFLSYSSEGLADEIAVIVVKDASDLSEAEASLEEHLDGRIKLYENYEPEQAARAKDAVVFTSGNCAVLIMCDDVDAVKAAFTKIASENE